MGSGRSSRPLGTFLSAISGPLLVVRRPLLIARANSGIAFTTDYGPLTTDYRKLDFLGVEQTHRRFNPFLDPGDDRATSANHGRFEQLLLDL